MSYAFNVKKVDGALVLENHESAAAHIPDNARFTVSGHTPSSDTSPVATLAVTLTTVTDDPNAYPKHVASASTSYTTERPA